VLIEVVRDGAAQAPAQPAMISGNGELSYADCLERSEAVARGLRASGIERFGVALASPEDVLVALVASSAVGSEACVYPADASTDTVAQLAARFSHDIVLTDDNVELPGLAVTLGRLSIAGEEPLPAPQRAPVLVLTTGTTGEPKGARHDWGKLVQAIRRRDGRPGNRWLLAYNLSQFGGIQILLHGLANRATLVAPPSRRPVDVIATIRDHSVSHASATPTFWRLVVSQLDPETAHELPLRQITLGGEAVPEGLIERLRDLFPDARISQIYGAAEFGTVVSVHDGRSGLPLSILDRDDDADYRLRIVDGELQIRSKFRMLGYHEAPDDEGEWRGSGDLVEVRGDRIHFVGRKTDIINVGGAKVHPLPIEEVASKVPGVRLATVYGRKNPVTGQIVAMDVVPDPGIDAEELEARLRAACEVLPAASRPQRIRFLEELEIRGHKVARQGGRTR
jgi:acyl-CoA synthetase (AMP-forming)/AMP-acid ligase II